MKNTLKTIVDAVDHRVRGVLLPALTLGLAGAAGAATPVPVVDPSSTYAPTQIINGSFDVEPWMTYTYKGSVYTECPTSGSFGDHAYTVSDIVFNGVDGGWNTTENQTFLWSLFEYMDEAAKHNIDGNVYNPVVKRSDRFVELNCQHAAALYEDLTTHGGDVIRWTLGHATSSNGEDTQTMHVEIGAPQRDAQGKIVNAYSSNDASATIDTKIVSATKAIYRYTGVTDDSENPSAIGFAGSDIENLKLSKSEQASKGLLPVSGFYVIPDGQSVTRFAFVSDDTTKPANGNLLDNVTFSTLIGNLQARQAEDDSVDVTGYWGDTNTLKQLVIKVAASTLNIDMATVCNTNFTLNIPSSTIAGAATLTVYHQDYESAKRTVVIQRNVAFTPETVEHATAAVYTNDVPVAKTGDAYLVISNSAASVVYTADGDYYLEGGRKAVTNAIDTTTNPATMQGDLPKVADPVKYVAPVYVDNVASNGIAYWTTNTLYGYTVVTGAAARVTWGSAGAESWYVVHSGTFQIDGGVLSTGDVHLVLCDGAKLTVTNAAEYRAGIETDPTGSFTVYEMAAPATPSSRQLGELAVIGGEYAAGIGGGFEGSGSFITINGGIVTVTGGDYGAAIGGGEEGSGSNITVNAGIVTATGVSDAAAIGGGFKGSGSFITINGGTVTATGDGAGIGGGFKGAGTFITINGGTVSAAGDTGVGGGYKGVGAFITINGGTVTATGSTNGAGIGGGSRAAGSAITINGGTVTATGATNAAGIGGGTMAAGSDITINGGTVTATGGIGGAAIGGGFAGAGENISLVSGLVFVVTAEISPNSYTPDLIGCGGASASAASGNSVSADAKVFFNLTGLLDATGNVWLESIAAMPATCEGFTIMTPETQRVDRVLVGGCGAQGLSALPAFALTNAVTAATGTITVDGSMVLLKDKLLNLTSAGGALALKAYGYSTINPPEEVANTTATVYTNGAAAVVGAGLPVTNGTPAYVVYTADDDFAFLDGTTAKTNAFDTTVNPATVVGALPTEPSDHWHCLCGDGACTAEGHVHEVVGWKKWTATDSLPNTAGNWYLASDVTLAATYAPPTGVNLCLNGHVIRETASVSVISVASGCTFTLTDCDKTTTHYYTVGSTGLWTLNTSASSGMDYETLTARPSTDAIIAVKGGVITGGSPGNLGGGIVCYGNFTLYGGNVIGNTARVNHGGGIAVSGSSATFTMNGGRLVGNYTTRNSSGICGNGGGLDVENSSTATINDGEICFNAADRWAGAIFLRSSTLTIAGGTINYNLAQNCGGGAMDVDESATLNIIGGTMMCNKCNATSGGIAMESGTITMGGTPVITNNTDSSGVSNLRLYGKIIAVSQTTPFAEGASVGVTTSTTPSESAPVAITDANGAGCARYFTSDAGFDVFNVGATVYLGVQSCFYVSKTGNDSNAGTVDAPLATLSAACAKIGSVGTIALLSDIDAPAGSSPALTVTDGKTVAVTSAKADGTLLTNAEGDYTGVYTIHRADNTCSLIYLSNGNLTFEQVVVTGDAKNFTYGGSYGQGFLIYAPGSAADDTLTLGVNSIVRDNINLSNNGAACGGGIVFGSENNAHNPKMYMNANAAIYGCIAPRHGGALTIYDGDLYMSDNATMMYNGVDLPSGTTSAYFGGGAILAYRGNVHMSGNATITKNYVQLNGGDDQNRCHNSMQIDGNTASVGYVKDNVRIFDNYDDGHLVRNADGTYTVTGTKQANASAKAGAFYVDGAMGDTAKIGVTVQSAALNSVVANGTTAYTVTDADANQFFDDTETYKVTKSSNTLIFGAEVVSTTLTLGTFTTTGLTGSFGQDIGATANDITIFKDGVKLDSGYTVTFDGANFTITFDPALSDKAVIGVTVSKNGYKVNGGAVTYAYNHKHCLCGDGACTAAGHSHSDVDWQLWTSSTALPTTAGNWFLLSDVTLTTAYVPPTGVNLCLNGHVVRETTSGQRVMLVNGGVSFALTDCNKTTTHNFKVGSDGLWAYTTDAATTNYEDLVARPAADVVVAVKGGCLTGGYADHGGGVYNSGTLTLWAGTIVGNTSTSNGSGVYNGDTMILNGGLVCGNRMANTSTYGCGIFVAISAHATMNGGAVSYNYSKFAGGGIGNFGSFVLAAGDLIGNLAEWGGGGIYTGSNDDDGSTFLMKGGTISGNVALDCGGGIGVNYNCDVKLFGGNVINNQSPMAGGVESGWLAVNPYTLGGDIKIVDNTLLDGTTPNNLYIYPDCTISITNDPALTSGAAIGVFTETKPTTTTKVAISSNRGEDYVRFTSDEGCKIVNEDDKVKLALAFTLTFYNRPTSTDETVDGRSFYNNPTNVTYIYGDTSTQAPNVVKPNAKFLGWSTVPTATVPEYTNDQLSTITTTPGDNIILYSVYGVEVGVPVFVALDECSTLPGDGRLYTFAITNVTSGAVLPTNCYASIVVPTNRGEACCTGYAADDPENPWRWMLTEGAFDYDIKQTTEARNDGEVLDDGVWGVTVTVNPNATPRYSVKSVYKHKVDDLGENSFDVVKAITSGEFVTAADVSVVNGQTKLTLGGDAVRPDMTDWRYLLNTAVLKGKFEIDFSQDFRVVGSFTPQSKATPDGTCIGFLPSAAVPTSDQVFAASGNYLGYMTIPCFEKSLVLDFDNYANDNVNGDPEPFFEHFSLTETGGDTGDATTSYCAKFATAQFADVSSRWPNGACTYLIENDTATTTLTFRVVLPSNETLNFVYTNAPAYFGSTKAYFFMSGSIRRGPNGSYACGEVGTTAPSLEVLFDSFNYLGRADGYDSVTNVFVNRQEAFVTYNAWGGQFADGTETNAFYAEDAETEFPVDPTRAGNYTFDGWYRSWTNGAAKVSEGLLDPIEDTAFYAKWISPSTPKGEGEKTMKYETTPDGSGAVLKGATNELQTTDLAIPEFTSNGADGLPYTIIEKKAFFYRNYDKPIAVDTGHPEKRLTSVTVSTYVTNIQTRAFADCQMLSNVTFSQTRDYKTGEKAKLVIDDWAFQGSSVKEIRFPADCQVVLDDGAFADTVNLTDVYLLGDVTVEANRPFRGAGFGNLDADGNQIPVNLHLSAKLASDPAFVLSLTNGMPSARIVLDQQIQGQVTIVGTPVYTDPMSFTFTVESDSPWLKVTTDTVYLFWSTSLTADKTFIGNEPLKPKTLTGPDGDGRYTATFDKPATPGGTAAFFQLCIGDAR